MKKITGINGNPNIGMQYEILREYRQKTMKEMNPKIAQGLITWIISIQGIDVGDYWMRKTYKMFLNNDFIRIYQIYKDSLIEDLKEIDGQESLSNIRSFEKKIIDSFLKELKQPISRGKTKIKKYSFLMSELAAPESEERK